MLQSVVDPIEEIARAASTDLVDEDGEHVALAVQPGLPVREIDALQQQLGVALPKELRDLLAHTARIDGVLQSVDFAGRSVGGFEFPEIFPAGLAIADDGFGNCWVIDLTPGS